MPVLSKLLHDFIEHERNSLDAEQSNYVGFVFGDIPKYCRYLEEINPRIEEASTKYRQLNLELGKILSSLPSQGARSKELGDKINTITNQELKVHLELESLYLYSNILLDRTFAATQYYFGPDNKVGRSFDAMTQLEEYAFKKGLSSPAKGMGLQIKWLQKHVCTFRHLLIAHKHEKDSYIRIHFATDYHTDSREASFNLLVFYPSGGEEKIVSKKPSEIMQYLSAFLRGWVAYLKLNSSKRVLRFPDM